MALRENYKDDILDVSVNTKRKYRMTENPDGTISLEDETVYTQEGDSFGSGDINATNGKVNTLDSAVTTLNANLDGFKFYSTGTELIALQSDDSYYTDNDGKYIIADSPTGQQMLEDYPSTYKALASVEDLRGEVGADTAIPFSKKTRTVTKQISVPPYSGSDLTYKETVFTELTEIVGITKIIGDGQHPSYHQSEFFSAETYDNIVKITVYRKQPSPTTPMVFNVTVAGY